ncbi:MULTISPECIES: hypothetical protein [Bacillus]|uniref:hypothetical protein n=1 Tax=Bacillus TaxID=1386 RepID=UPI0008A8B9C3|nr:MULTISPECIES: hypothetical protein [Bacillus]HDR3313301.1 hypothetical protein [Bacillus thuringiensis]MDA2021376.1 hypothetical protein [Bacillus cereus]OHO72418.1 hypothetical protein HMPREF2590_03830 [Bacillus sp. HMSC036E02]PES66553.1 hypothetical protein CN512_19100 [Bacillus cereus]PFQ37948.1 hypothetical protein COK17_04755 [Bacillus cereus]
MGVERSKSIQEGIKKIGEVIKQKWKELYDKVSEACLSIFYTYTAIKTLVIRGIIEKHPLLSFLVLSSVLTVMVVFMDKSYNHKDSLESFESIYNFLTFGSGSIKGYAEIDNAVFTSLDSVTQLFKISLPATLTFYYFIYKEQKSISSNLAKGFPLWRYLSTTIIALILGSYILFNKSYYSGNFFSGDYFFPIVIWSVLMVLSFLFFVRLIHKLLESLDIRLLFRHKRRKFKGEIRELYYTNVNSKDNYEQLNTYLESIFQSFEYTLDKGLDKLFEHELQRWGAILSLIMDEAPRQKQHFTTTANRLFQKSDKSRKGFEEFYSLLLNKQGDLLFKLVAKNRLVKINDALEALKSLEPNKVKGLYPRFITSLDEMILKSYKQKSLPIGRILDLLNSTMLSYLSEGDKKHLEEERDFNIAKTVAVIYIYKSILKEAVEADSVKDITSITYSLCGIFKEITADSQESEVKHEPESNGVAEGVNNNVLTAMQEHMNKAKSKSNYSEHGHIKKIVLFILFQMALKAVELNHYKLVGQLVKRITTDFDALAIRNTFEEFRSSEGQMKKASFLQEEELKEAFSPDSSMISQMYTDILFNKQSLDYCMQKLAILIYAQQYYICIKHLTFTEYYKTCHQPLSSINLAFLDKEYLDYTLGKIKQVGKGYGLLFVDEKNFEEQMKIEIEKDIGATV